MLEVGSHVRDMQWTIPPSGPPFLTEWGGEYPTAVQPQSGPWSQTLETGGGERLQGKRGRQVERFGQHILAVILRSD
jgi:hypothetical protein